MANQASGKSKEGFLLEGKDKCTGGQSSQLESNLPTKETCWDSNKGSQNTEYIIAPQVAIGKYNQNILWYASI
jgi:hypothetical protein